MKHHVLGISAFYHDSAACLVRDGEIVAAAQEERFTRKKGDASFPSNAISYCLRAGGVSPEGLAAAAFLEEGFRYDSSIYPILHDRYGRPNAPRFPFEIRRNGNGRLIGFPIGTVRLLGVNLPIGGGGYFRLLPLAVSRWRIRRVNARERQPLMFYFHPWELDPEQPRPPMAWRHRFRHYVGLQREEAKLAGFFRRLGFGTARDVLGIQ